MSWELGIDPQTSKRNMLLAGAVIFVGARCLTASVHCGGALALRGAMAAGHDPGLSERVDSGDDSVGRR